MKHTLPLAATFGQSSRPAASEEATGTPPPHPDARPGRRSPRARRALRGAWMAEVSVASVPARAASTDLDLPRSGGRQVRCRCPSTGEERDLAFWGFDSGRNALKYRCPAAAHGFACEGRAACERMGGGQPGQYGRVVRIGLDQHDQRIFTPAPYGSPAWKRGYRRRAALERINARVDRSFEFEQHFIRGLSRMRTRVGLALSVMMALALGQVRAGRPGRMRSLYGPVPWADTG